MRTTIRLVTLLSLAAGAVAAGQNPPPPPPPQGAPGMPGGDHSAQTFLGQSAQLELTDAQVVKLAAIARRSEARRKTLRSAMDSAGQRFNQPGDSVARRQFAQRMQTEMTKERDQSRVDLRDALAVLTPDQQARAWQMMSNRGSMGRGPNVGGGPGRGGAMRGGPGGMRPGRPMGPGRGRRPEGMRPDGMAPEFGARRGDATRPMRPMPSMRPQNVP